MVILCGFFAAPLVLDFAYRAPAGGQATVPPPRGEVGSDVSENTDGRREESNRR